MNRIESNAKNVKRNMLEPVPQQAQAQAVLPPPPLSQVSPFMMCSLPARAATLDQYQRQFYGRNYVPQYRILTPNIS